MKTSFKVIVLMFLILPLNLGITNSVVYSDQGFYSNQIILEQWNKVLADHDCCPEEEDQDLFEKTQMIDKLVGPGHVTSKAGSVVDEQTSQVEENASLALPESLTLENPDVTDTQVDWESSPKKSVLENSDTKEKEPSIKTKISIHGEQLPLKDVLRSISKVAQLNLIYGPQVDNEQTISAQIDDLEVWQALNTILYPLSYGFSIDKKNIYIRATERRVFTINLPPVNQAFSESTSNESFVSGAAGNNSDQLSGSGQELKVGTQILVKSSVDEMSLWNDIVNNLNNLVSEKGTFNINKSAGLVVVTDSPLNLNSIEAFINEVNSKFSRQIEVVVKVVEVTFTDEHSMGVDWNALARNLKGLDTVSLATNFASNHYNNSDYVTFKATGHNPDSGIASSGVNAVIQALNAYGDVEIVSQPRIALMNNIPAVIQVGTAKAYISSSDIQTTEIGTTTSISTSQVHSGVTMRLMGSIVNDNIYLSVTPSVTTVDSIRSVTSGTSTVEAPQTTTKSLNTIVRVKEDETAAIGGLITTTRANITNGVPLLSNIPAVGKLFTFTEKKNNKTELIIFITPRKM